MIQVDPAGLASTAQRIADVLAELMGGDPVHPPLGADPASAGAAARLSTAGASLVAVIGQQALGLAVTAAQLLDVSTTFEAQDLLNKSGLDKLGIPDLITVTGWAPPSPPIPPGHPAAAHAAAAVPGEALSTAVHSGRPERAVRRSFRRGESWFRRWRVPPTPCARPPPSCPSSGTARSPPTPCATTCTATRRRSIPPRRARRTLAWQADRHAEQNVHARNDIPTPQQYAELRAADPDGVGGQHRLRRPLRRPAHPAAGGDDRAGLQDDATATARCTPKPRPPPPATATAPTRRRSRCGAG